MSMKIEAEILNATKNGISIECCEKLKEGTLYTVRLFWCGSIFYAKCEAVWSFSNGSGDKYRSGMKFIHVDNIDDFLT